MIYFFAKYGADGMFDGNARDYATDWKSYGGQERCDGNASLEGETSPV